MNIYIYMYTYIYICVRLLYNSHYTRSHRNTHSSDFKRLLRVLKAHPLRVLFFYIISPHSTQSTTHNIHHTILNTQHTTHDTHTHQLPTVGAACPKCTTHTCHFYKKRPHDTQDITYTAQRTTHNAQHMHTHTHTHTHLMHTASAACWRPCTPLNCHAYTTQRTTHTTQRIPHTTPLATHKRQHTHTHAHTHIHQMPTAGAACWRPCTPLNCHAYKTQRTTHTTQRTTHTTARTTHTTPRTSPHTAHNTQHTTHTTQTHPHTHAHQMPTAGAACSR